MDELIRILFQFSSVVFFAIVAVCVIALFIAVIIGIVKGFKEWFNENKSDKA